MKKILKNGKINPNIISITPMKAIRKKCLECSGGQQKEIKFCNIYDCPLYPYRMGSYPRPEDLSKEFITNTDLLDEDTKRAILENYPLLEDGDGDE
ncbi:hypothetical protein DRN58_09665 [Thermococci archaeon]|nr:MAG: hypothetical protein DRN58_09665 [Thermococci archaeon]